jgi:hypothetical protein
MASSDFAKRITRRPMGDGAPSSSEEPRRASRRSVAYLTISLRHLVLPRLSRTQVVSMTLPVV